MEFDDDDDGVRDALHGVMDAAAAGIVSDDDAATIASAILFPMGLPDPPTPDVDFYTRRVPAYRAWMDANVKGDGYGTCEKMAKAMARAFPGLLEVRKGFFFSLFWGRRGHWWCREKATGQIVDPTAMQHPDGRPIPGPTMARAAYEDLTDLDERAFADKVPSGVCMNCGEDCYHGAHFCSERCEAIVLSELNGP